MCIFKAGLSDLTYGLAKYKEKVPDVSDYPIKILKQHTIQNSGLEALRIYSSKECRKTSQRSIMYVANTGILKL